MLELARLASFLLFVALGLRVRRSPDAQRGRAVQHLLGYVLALSALVGVLQWDDWPFTSHTIAVGRARAESRICQTQFYGVDGGGREWRLDPYTFTPVYDSIMQYWVEQALPRLQEPQRARVLEFLLARAEQARRHLTAGRAIGPRRLLGPAGAPYWLLMPRFTQAPAQPYAGLRAYSVCWTPARRLRDGDSALLRRLTAEWPPGPAGPAN